ncbi:MAG: dihydrolipoamide acetyltransferase family protein [Bacillota bacterium]|nr:dihydrolipoamide acetyltransferase family protein [Bacillota bacterium]
MATPIIMPKQGQTVESCILTVWHKQVGEQVFEGDLLFSYETDKAVFDEESTAEGVLLEILFEEGDEVPVLTTIGLIGEEGEQPPEADAQAFHEADQAEDTHPSEKDAVPKPIADPVEPVLRDGDRVKASPRARRLAAEIGVDYRQASPSGAEGRVVSQDVLALKPQVAPEIVQEQDELHYEEVELSRARKLIGDRMRASFSEVPRVTLNTSFDASELLDLRKKLKADRSEQGLSGVTLNDMVIYAVSRTILNHPELNAHLLGEKTRLFRDVHLGIAVDTERGLMVPTFFDANRKSLRDTSVEIKSMIQQCHDGNINPDYLQGATFTVTNLGPLGIESFSPIINLPQTGILGVNSIAWKLKEQDGEYIPYPAMGLSLTFDHRAVDGAQGARFLKELTGRLETFSLLLCV